MMHYEWVIAVSLILSMAFWSLFLFRINNQSGQSSSDTEHAVIQVSPSRGAPGWPLEITGYKVNPDDTKVMIIVGDNLTPLLADSGSIFTLVPLFLHDGSLWPRRPSGFQDVCVVEG